MLSLHLAKSATASTQTTFLLAASVSDSSECVGKLIVLLGVVLLPACLDSICRGLARRFSPGCSSWLTVRKSQRLRRESIFQTVGRVNTAAVIWWFSCFGFTQGLCSRTSRQHRHLKRLKYYEKLHNVFFHVNK